MAALQNIRINTDAEIRWETISEDQHCVIVDDFLKDPHELIEFAANHAGEFSKPERLGYPGLLFFVNDNAMTEIYRFIRSEMTQHFPFFRGGINLRTRLSMVTLQSEELTTRQRFCHTDPNPSPKRTPYAALVYLFENEDLGGTSFYRWRDQWLSKTQVRLMEATGIDLDDPDKGLAFLQKDFPTFREPACYMTDSNEIAERLCTIPARFNRMIFYSGTVPHSAAITAPELLSKDFRKGRLTLNLFARVLARE